MAWGVFSGQWIPALQRWRGGLRHSCGAESASRAQATSCSPPPPPHHSVRTLRLLQRGVNEELGAYLLPLIHDKEQR